MASMKSIGGLTTMKGANPMGVADKGGEYQADKLEMSGKKAGAKKISSVKGVLLDGPFGGKAPQS